MSPPALPDITCLLFDMDGVLVDVSRSYRSAIARTVERFTGQAASPAVIQGFKNRGGYNDDWELTAAIVRDAGVTVDFQDIVAEFQRLYRGTSWDGLITEESPLIGADVLHALAAAGIDSGIVTGRPTEEAQWTIDRFGWSDTFRVVIAREQQKDRPKPDGFPITAALDQFDRPHEPEHAAYVGDTVDDMRAAVHAAVAPVGFVPPYLDEVSHGDLLRRHGARAVISRHELLLPLIGVSHTG